MQRYGKAKQDAFEQYQSRDGAMESLECIKMVQDPKSGACQGDLRVGITSIIQHAGLLDAKERNKAKLNRTERYYMM